MAIVPEENEARHPLVSVLIVFVVLGTWLGVFFLSSPPASSTPALRPWSGDSLLKAICDTLALNYEVPTDGGVAIKDVIHGVGASIVLVLGAAGWYLSARSAAGIRSDEEAVKSTRTMSPTLGGQVLLGLFLVWGFLTSQWSHAPDYAIGGATVTALGGLWAFGVGAGLSRRHVPVVCLPIVVAGALVGGLNIWHHAVRQPPDPTGYPLGHPGALGSSLAVGLVISFALLSFVGAKSGQFLGRKRLLMLAGLLVAIGISGWSLWLAAHWPSRIGLIAGLACLLCFQLGRRARLPIIAIALVLIGIGVHLAVQKAQQVNDPLGDEIRLHGHAWGHALELIKQRPMTGHGPGGFVLYGEALASGYALPGEAPVGSSILSDPAAYGDGPLGRARSLWLELCCETGVFGLVFFAGAIGLSIVGVVGRGGLPGGDRTEPWRAGPWTGAIVSGIVAALAAETVDASFYRPGLPAILFVLIGLLWALDPRRGIGELGRAFLPVAGRVAVIVGVGLVCILGLRSAVLDWWASRDAFEAKAQLRSYEYDRAAALAQSACQYRLRPTRRIEAEMLRLAVYSSLARQTLNRGVQRFSRQRSGEGATSQPVGLAREDLEIAFGATQQGLLFAGELNATAPGYPGLGWETANLWDMALQASAFLHPERSPAQYPAEAASALFREYRRRPFVPGVAARLWRVSQRFPLVQQLEIVCSPLRLGRTSPELNESLVRIQQSDGVEAQFGPLIADASRTVVEAPDRWSVWFAPELLLVSGMFSNQKRDYATAADSLGRALEAGGDYTTTYPRAAALIRQQLAESLFLQNPQAPQAAIEMLTPAVGRSAQSDEDRVQINRLKYVMALYHLAGNEEDSARDLLSEFQPDASGPVPDELVGVAYASLATWLAPLSPRGQRPPVWQRAVERAYELAPSAHTVLLLRAQLAFEAADDSAVVAALKKLDEKPEAAEVVRRFLADALKKRPNSAPLVEYADSLKEAATNRGDQPPVPASGPVPPLESP